MRYAWLAQADKILTSPEPWLCYYRGDCSAKCPRGADPGETMMVMRRYKDKGSRGLERQKPHLICMDMRMPVMDGQEATRRSKASDQDGRAKIICISASSFEEQKELALSHGCDDFVRKPFREADIFDAISRHLGVRYVYDVETIPPSREVRGNAKQAPVTPEDLAGLPSDLLASLERAAESLKVNDVQDVIEQIREVDQNTGNQLANLAREFRYDLIPAGIRQARLQ